MEVTTETKQIDIHNTQIQLLDKVLELESSDNANRAFTLIHGIKDINSLIEALDNLAEFLPAESLQTFRNDIEELLLAKDFPIDSLKRRLAIVMIRTTVRDKVLQYLKPLTEEEVKQGTMVVVSAIEAATGISFEPEALSRLSEGLISAESWAKRTPEFSALSKDLIELHIKNPNRKTGNLIKILKPEHDISGICRAVFAKICMELGETASATTPPDEKSNNAPDNSTAPEASTTTETPVKKHERSFIQETMFGSCEKSAERFLNSSPEEQEEMTTKLIHQFTNARTHNNLILFCIIGSLLEKLSTPIEPALTEEELKAIYKHNLLMKADTRGIGRFLKLITNTLKASPVYGQTEDDIKERWQVRETDRPKILTANEKIVIEKLEKLFKKHQPGKKIPSATALSIAGTPEILLLAALIEFFENPDKIELVERVLASIEDGLESVSIRDVLDKAIPAYIQEYRTVDHVQIQNLQKLCAQETNIGMEIYERTGRALVKYRGSKFREMSAEKIHDLEAIEDSLPSKKFLPTQISFKEAETIAGTEEIIRQFISAIKNCKTSGDKIVIAQKGASTLDMLRNHLIKNGKIFSTFYNTCRSVEQLATTPEENSAATLLNQQLRLKLFPELIFNPAENNKGFKSIGSQKEHTQTRTGLESLASEHSKQFFLDLADKQFQDAILDLLFICNKAPDELTIVSSILGTLVTKNAMKLTDIQTALDDSKLGQGGTEDGLTMLSPEETAKLMEFFKEVGLEIKTSF